jgi:GGDEF domain-containing protein
VLLLPGVDERGAEQMLERVQELITLNTFYPGTLSLAMGCATARQGERLPATVTQADEQMMRVKREFYASSGFDRRASQHGHLG